MEDSELTQYEKVMVTLTNLYQEIPENIESAMEMANKFLDGGKVSKEEEEGDGIRLYSFSKDAALMFAAFRQTHGIDLSKETLHWWTFLALFMDLGADTVFCNLVSLRKRVKTGKASKEERAAAREMGDIFEVPEIDDRTLEEREAEARFFELAGKGAK